MRCYVCRLGVAVVCWAALAACGSDFRPLPSLTAPSTSSPGSAPQPPPRGSLSYTISGFVTEAVGGQTMPLGDAHVEDSERHVFVKSRADGSYTISDVALTQFGGAYIYFAKQGYRSQVRIVPLTAAETRVDVTLERE